MDGSCANCYYCCIVIYYLQPIIHCAGLTIAAPFLLFPNLFIIEDSAGLERGNFLWCYLMCAEVVRLIPNGTQVYCYLFGPLLLALLAFYLLTLNIVLIVERYPVFFYPLEAALPARGVPFDVPIPLDCLPR